MDITSKLADVVHATEGTAIQLALILAQTPESASLLSTDIQVATIELEKINLRLQSILDRTKNIKIHQVPHQSLVQANIKQIEYDARDLYFNLPGLQMHIQTVALLVSGPMALDEDKRRICLELRLGFEEMLNAILKHLNCPMIEGMPLGDRVLFLKPHLIPPVRLNCFFDLKEYSSMGVHKPIMGTDSISMRAIEKMVVAFRNVVEETKQILGSVPISVAQDKQTRTEPVAGLGRYKTVMCRNWKKYEKCPHGDRCLFAHGDEELRAAKENAN